VPDIPTFLLELEQSRTGGKTRANDHSNIIEQEPD
jgi:hypothetical protein